MAVKEKDPEVKGHHYDATNITVLEGWRQCKRPAMYTATRAGCTTWSRGGRQLGRRGAGCIHGDPWRLHADGSCTGRHPGGHPPGTKRPA